MAIIWEWYNTGFFSVFPYLLHIWLISGNDTTLTLLFSFVHIFSIYGQYLEMVQIRIKPTFPKNGNIRKCLNMDFTWPYNCHIIPIILPYFAPGNFQLWLIYGPYYFFGKGNFSILLLSQLLLLFYHQVLATTPLRALVSIELSSLNHFGVTLRRQL